MKITLKTAWKKRAKLWAEGDKLWAEAVISIKGNVKMEWIYRSEKNDYACILAGNDTFEPL